MNWLIAIGAGAGIFTTVAFVLLFRAVLRRDRFDGLTPDWLSNFSVARYKPMERLLCEDDFRFLAAQKGFEPKIARRLRAERRKIFREYLRCLSRDFGRLEAAVRLFMVHAMEDRPELAKALLRQRLAFTYGIIAAECRLVMHTFGIGTVDIRNLVGSLDMMRIQAGQLAVARQATSL